MPDSLFMATTLPHRTTMRDALVLRSHDITPEDESDDSASPHQTTLVPSKSEIPGETSAMRYRAPGEESESIVQIDDSRERLRGRDDASSKLSDELSTELSTCAPAAASKASNDTPLVIISATMIRASRSEPEDASDEEKISTDSTGDELPLQQKDDDLLRDDNNATSLETDQQITPGLRVEHRRFPSSSIPHLLSNSMLLAEGHLGGLLEQLSLSEQVGDDPTVLSGDQGDSNCKPSDCRQTSSPRVIPTSNIPMPGPSPLASSNLSSSASLSSYLSPSHSLLESTRPTNYTFKHDPPMNVAGTSYIESRRRSITSDDGNDIATPQLEGSEGQVSEISLPPSNRGDSEKKLLQPVLYSAINSLERYNANSFDNNVMLAKARGQYFRSSQVSAFPGVPRAQQQTSDCGDLSRHCSSEGDLSKVNLSAADNLKPTIKDQGESSSDVNSANVHRQPQHSLFEETQPIKDGVPKTIFRSNSTGGLADDITAPLKSDVNSKKASKVSLREDVNTKRSKRPITRRVRSQRVGVFRPSSDAYTPRMNNREIKFRSAHERPSTQISSTMGTIQRPNFRDALRRVAIILHQHIVKIETRFSTGIRGVDHTGLFKADMRQEFREGNFSTPRYKCSMVRVPMARPGVVYSMRKIKVVHTTPTTDEIYEFAHQLFKKVQLSSECSIVCLIYVEKLMEVAKVPLVAETWRPIFMCGLLLASKVWQDLSSWNIEFASVYPQFSLDAINKLEVLFLKHIKWDLYISSSLYAKYYFALRSLLEKSDFRSRYNGMVGAKIGGVAANEALKVSKRSIAVKEEALLQLSKSM
mmetsp:Transcript_21624/g.50875  ORF Transcript_21624/g.50875 Transcript_21624/m.50875 type:complete len:814 (-) Transcript_21624:33-2474(-)